MTIGDTKGCLVISSELVEGLKLSKLQIEILKLSESKDWECAVAEWTLSYVYIVEQEKDYEICLCGHYPIKEVCVLLNKHNKNSVRIGNCCVKKFLDNESDLIFKCFGRLLKDISSSLNTAMLEYVFRMHVFNSYEYSFYKSNMLKRNLTTKQFRFKVRLNKRVLDYFKKSYVFYIEKLSNSNLSN